MKNLSFFLLITILSCNSKAPVKPVKSYLFDLEKAKVSYKVTDLIKSMDFIKLEKGEGFLLSDITKIEMDDDKIFIQDSDKKNIFVFDTVGRHLTNLVSIGKGPGELTTAYFFAIDKLNDHIYVADPWSRKMIKYSYDGIILKENKDISCSGDMGVLNGTLVADISGLYLPRFDEHRDKSNFIKYNFDADSIWSVSVTGNYYRNKDISFQAHHRFLNLNNYLFFLDEIGGNVMEFNGDTLSVKYKIDFGKNDMGYQRIKRFSKNMGEFIPYTRKKSFAFITNLYETNDFIFVEIDYNRITIHGVINKENDNIVIYNGLDLVYSSVSSIDDFNYPCSPIIIGANDDEFIGFVQPFNIVKSTKTLGKGYQKIAEKYSLQDVKEDDNPILALLKFKSAPKTTP